VRAGLPTWARRARRAPRAWPRLRVRRVPQRGAEREKTARRAKPIRKTLARAALPSLAAKPERGIARRFRASATFEAAAARASAGHRTGETRARAARPPEPSGCGYSRVPVIRPEATPRSSTSHNPSGSRGPARIAKAVNWQNHGSGHHSGRLSGSSEKPKCHTKIHSQEVRTELFAAATPWTEPDSDTLRCPGEHARGVRADSMPIAAASAANAGGFLQSTL